MRDVATGRGYPWPSPARGIPGTGQGAVGPVAGGNAGAGTADRRGPGLGPARPTRARPGPDQRSAAAAGTDCRYDRRSAHNGLITTTDRTTVRDHTRRPFITRRRVVISVLLAGCAVGLVYGASIGRPDNKPIVYTDPAIKSLTPQPGEAAPRQARIGVTLNAAYTLAQQNTSGMSINGQGIPQDEIDVVAGLNQFFYTPGPGKEVSSLPPGRNCATLMIKRVSDPADNGHPYGWCFQSQ
jgi:hypothetical protein